MIKKNDVIEINYTAKLAEDNQIFDTTEEQVAKDNNLYSEEVKGQFKPLILCVGQGQVIQGLDNSFIGKKSGDNFSIDITSEQGFGKKDPKLIQLVSMSKFKKEKIRPMVGMQVNIDDSQGIIRSVSGGRVVIDFNHPFSGRDLSYNVKIIKTFEENKEKLTLLVKSMFGIESEVKIEGKKADITLKLPANVPKESINDQIKATMAEKLKEITDLDVKIII
jgi:FKBP-type peptidyl-prolyl cis-trans isomerase 2